MVPKLILSTIVLLSLSEAGVLAAPPDFPTAPEEIVAPQPHEIFPSIPANIQNCPRQVLEQPSLIENSQPPPIEAARPAVSDQILPINLATALYLSNARPLVIAFAQASIEQASAQLQNANVLWLPNLNIGFDYYRHDGMDQATDGTMIFDNKYSYTAGGGVTLSFGVTDAIFRPLAARRELAAREFDLQSAQNDALLTVAVAYFDVQQARGILAGNVDSVAKAEMLVKKTTGLSKGLVPEIEVDRARSLLLDLQQQVALARANWRISSSRLTRVLRLNPSAVVDPMEPPHLLVTLISPQRVVDELVPVGLTNRPELASQRALVQATLERLRQERVRPLVPSLVLDGRNGPYGALEGGVFGGGPDGTHTSGGRFDMEVGVLWTLNNLGAGNRSLVRQRAAEQQKAYIELFNIQDQVAQEVVQAHAQLEATAAQIDDATAAVKEATITFNGTLRALGQTRGSGELLILLSRPQEAVAALQQLNRAYETYYAAINNYNRAQFQLYRALGFPAQIVVCKTPVGEVETIDTSRPPSMAPFARISSRLPAPTELHR
jgi:outer membrane protein TolC